MYVATAMWSKREEIGWVDFNSVIVVLYCLGAGGR